MILTGRVEKTQNLVVIDSKGSVIHKFSAEKGFFTENIKVNNSGVFFISLENNSQVKPLIISQITK